MPDNLEEQLAEYAHASWSGWIKYMFSKCEEVEKGGGRLLVIPAWAVQRWVRQASTEYADLPESEKESDRVEARKMISIVGAITQEREEVSGG